MENENNEQSNQSTVPVDAPTDQPAADGVPVASEEILDFYRRYKLAMFNWAKTHGKQPPPIIENPITGKLMWVNRAMRRKHTNKRINVYAHNYR